MKILVFGTGRIYQKRKSQIQNNQIVAFIDNNQQLWGKQIDGIIVTKPDEVQQLDYDAVWIMSIYKQEMKQQLIGLGVPENKIVFYDEADGRNSILYSRTLPIEQTGKKVLFFTHDLSASGAPIALFYFACIMKKNGYIPAVICRTEGIMQHDFINAGIPVIIDNNISKSNWLLWGQINSFDFFVLNTIIFSDIVEDISLLGKKMIWWLHDSEIYYENRNANFYPKKILENVFVYAVGHRAQNAFQKYVDCEKVNNLLYGIPDMRIESKKNVEGKHIFAMVGAICERKAQDIFIQAILTLSEEERNEAEFWIIGIVTDIEFNVEIRKIAKDIPQIKFMGDLSREEMLKKYGEIDVICCPSRDDPMPVVATEAFMNGKIVIVSENTGTASLIMNGENGYVCENENASELGMIIRKIISGAIDDKLIGKNARRLYDENFSLTSFEKSIISIFDKLEEGVTND